MRIYKGSKRIAYKYLRKGLAPRIELFSTLSPGDYIGTCAGFNVPIVSIEHCWRRLGRRTSVIDDIIFTDARGYRHFVGSLGCVWTKFSNEEIIESWLSWARTDAKWGFMRIAREVQRRHLADEPILTEHGEPVFDIDSLPRA